MRLEEAPTEYGRFEILNLLGKGAQGKVYLARDPHLDRKVAIKSLILQGEEREKYLETLKTEARIVSMLQHPNIVTLFDAGEQGGEPYLVFEHVNGKTLKDLLKVRKTLTNSEAVKMAIQILEGVEYAHKHNIVHRDLKPENIMIDDKNHARIMDFGIAISVSGLASNIAGFAGTPLYAAPEYLSRGECGPRADLFSVGVILYRMLAGRTVIIGRNVEEIVNSVLTEQYAPPSAWAQSVDETLDNIVMCAISKEPTQRYQSATAMLEALDNYLHPRVEEIEDSNIARQSTLEFLLRRMKHKSDFPVLSDAVTSINKIISSDNESVSALSNIILKDFSLTSKLLKAVNKAYYAQFGGVSTVSRAIVIMGFEGVRNLALSLLMLEHLQNKSQAANLQEEISGAFFSGILAKELFKNDNRTEVEKAFVCTMFLNLGKLLATYYFYEETLIIDKLIKQNKMSESAASTEVLGLSYENLGKEIAREWKFPDEIIQCMSPIKEEKVPRAVTKNSKLQVVANFANEIRKITTDTDGKENLHDSLDKLCARYGNNVPLNASKLSQVVSKSVDEFKEQARALNMNLNISGMTKNISRLNKAEVTPESEEATVNTSINGGISNLIDNADLENTIVKEEFNQQQEATNSPEATEADSKARLTAGIEDISDALVSGYSQSDLLRMILETIFCSLPFSRVMFCIRDAKTNRMTGRFGLGEGVEELTNEFSFSMKYEPDVFHVSLTKARDIYIEDTFSEKVKSYIPDWYWKKVSAASFIIFPIIVDGKIIGMLYGDQVKAKVLHLGAEEVNLLRSLRNQAVLGFSRKS